MQTVTQSCAGCLGDESIIWGLLSLPCFLTASWAWARLSGLRHVSERILVAYVALLTQIVMAGYALSHLDALALPAAWSGLGAFFLLLPATIALAHPPSRGEFLATPDRARSAVRSISSRLLQLRRNRRNSYSWWLCVLLLGTLLAVGTANLVLVVSTSPNNPDSLAYHLPRVAYYLRQGNLDRYPAGYWAQIVHLKAPAVLLAYSAVVTAGRDSWWQLWQYSAYWMAVLSVYATAKRLGQPTTSSFVGAATFGLVVVSLLQSTTTQNDLLVAVVAGIIVTLLLGYAETGLKRYLAWTGLSLGLQLSLKFTGFLVIPSVALFAATVFWQGRERHLAGAWRHAGILLVCAAAGVLLLAIPGGYVENWRFSGHVLGPQDVRERHSYVNASPGQIAAYGTLNLLRYAHEFLDLDGLPNLPPFVATSRALQWPLEKVMLAAGVGPEATAGVRDGMTLRFAANLKTTETQAYAGILGFGLILPVMFWTALRRTAAPAVRWLAIAGCVYMLVVAYSGPYDWYRGRNFVPMLLWGSSLVAVAFTELIGSRRLVRLVFALVLALGCATAVSATLVRPDNAIISFELAGVTRVSKLGLNRIDQFIQGRQDCEPVKRYEAIVPADAVVAISLAGNACEYPLFGQRLARTVVPVRWTEIPPDADFLVYDRRIFPARSADDVHLGIYWYLRDLRVGETNDN